MFFKVVGVYEIIIGISAVLDHCEITSHQAGIIAIGFGLICMGLK